MVWPHKVQAHRDTESLEDGENDVKKGLEDEFEIKMFQLDYRDNGRKMTES